MSGRTPNWCSNKRKSSKKVTSHKYSKGSQNKENLNPNSNLKKKGRPSVPFNEASPSSQKRKLNELISSATQGVEDVGLLEAFKNSLKSKNDEKYIDLGKNVVNAYQNLPPTSPTNRALLNMATEGIIGCSEIFEVSNFLFLLTINCYLFLLGS